MQTIQFKKDRLPPLSESPELNPCHSEEASTTPILGRLRCLSSVVCISASITLVAARPKNVPLLVASRSSDSDSIRSLQTNVIDNQ